MTHRVGARRGDRPVAYGDRMRQHPLRTLLIVALAAVAAFAYRRATADRGGVYDPQAVR